MSVTQDIKDRIDIVSYVQQYAPDLKKAGRYYKACCPFHSEKTPSFVVNPDTQSWRCFGACAEGGDIFSFAQKQNGWSFREALEELGRQAGVEVNQQTPEQRAANERRTFLRGMLQTAADFYHQHLLYGDDAETDTVRRYVADKRGFNDETVKQWLIGYAPRGWQNIIDALKELGYTEDDIVEAGLARRNDKGRVYDAFRHRLMIPIRDERGRVVGFGARALDPDEQAKYINSPQSVIFDKSKLLFGLDLAKDAARSADTVVIVEGYMDVIQAHQAGFHNVVAQMGTALTETQIKKLVSYARHFVLALDSDAAGQNATRRSLEVARQALQADYMAQLAIDIRILQIEGAKDPDDILRETPEIWEKAVAQAQDVTDFVIDMESADLQPSASLVDRQAVARRVLPILLATESDMYRHAAIQKLAMKLRIGEADLQLLAQTVQQEEQARTERQQRAQQRPPAPDKPASPVGDYQPEPPPWDDDEYFVPIVPDTAVSSAPVERRSTEPVLPMDSRNSSRMTEAFCLRALIDQPSLMYMLNRRLRELADDDDGLVSGPLHELHPDDFSQTDYRRMFDLLLAAVRQHEMEPRDYLSRQIEPALKREYDRVTQTEYDWLLAYTEARYVGDANPIWVDFERRSKPLLNIEVETIQRLLVIRQHRLRREHQELYFLMQEASRSDDRDLKLSIFAQVKQCDQAIHRLNTIMNERPDQTPQFRR